ncbi:MAG: HAMP domain-containing protein [Hyphomicrobiaceae bacterium]|nr:HAMP domain-containing protein [Hyphomicrobiaceae bacterium]
MPAKKLTNPPAFWRTTAFRLTATVTALFMVAAIAISLALYWSTSDLLLRQYIADTVRDARSLRSLLAGADSKTAARVVSARLARGDSSFLLLLTDRDGTKRAGNIDVRPADLKPDGRADVFEARVGGGAIVAVGVSIRLGGEMQLVVARSAQPVVALTARLKWMILLASGLVLTVGALAGYAMSRIVLRRIAEIARTGDRFMRGEGSERIPLAGTADEFDDLARSLNAMFARIEQLMAGMREVSDNIAHDLKTPLNRLRIRAEDALADKVDDQARRHVLETIVQDTDEIIRTFNALLQVARLEAGMVDPRQERFDMTALVRDIFELYEPVAEESGSTLRLGRIDKVMLRGHRQLIGQAITNLIENALKYGAQESAGGKADVTVSLQRSDRETILEVADRGPGIPASERENALRRFVRLDQSRSKPGTGLGLALVAAVARGHDGRIVLLDNAPGLTAQLRLPADSDGALLPHAETGRKLQEVDA